MEAYVDISSARKRNGIIGAKVAVTGYDEGTTFYAIRQVKSGELIKSIIHTYDCNAKKWVLTPNLEDKLVSLIYDVFKAFLTDSWNLFSRKMSDERGEYYIMYRDGFVDNTERESWDKEWDIKLGEYFVVAETNDYGDLINFSRRRFGIPDDNYETFKPTTYELERIEKAYRAGIRIRNARRDFSSRQRYAEVLGNGMRDLSDNQRSYVRSERRRRSNS